MGFSDGFPNTDAAIRATIRRTVLHTRVAKGVARKAGLFARASAPSPTTVLDAYIDPEQEGLSYQWLVDFSGVSEIRLASQSSATVYLMRSLLGVESEAYDATDYVPLDGALGGTGTQVFSSRTLNESGDDLRWYELDISQQIPMRLGLSTDGAAVGWNAGALDGPFSVALQVK